MKLKKTPDTTDAVTGLAQRVEHARGRIGVLAPDAVEALINAPSDAELAQARENAEHQRLRRLQAERDELDSQLAAHDSLRDAQVKLMELDIRDAIDARKALAEERRVNAASAKLARLHRYSTRTPMVCGVVIAIGMIWSAINVQQNMAPGGMSDPMFWASFLIEGMVSGLLIMVALGSNVIQETAGIEPGAKERWAEGGLLAFTLGLNTYPYVRDGHWYDAALHAVAPVMIGVALLVMHGLGARYAEARRQIAEEAIDLDVNLPGLPDLPTVSTVQQQVYGGEGDPSATETVYPDGVSDEDRTPATVHRDEDDRAFVAEPEAEQVYGRPETVPAEEVTAPLAEVTVHPVEATTPADVEDRTPATVHPGSDTTDAVESEADDVVVADVVVDDQDELASEVAEVAETQMQVSPELVADIEAATAGVLRDRTSAGEAARAGAYRTGQPQGHGGRPVVQRAPATVHADPVGAASAHRTVQPTVHGSTAPVPATVHPEDSAEANLERWMHGVMSGVQVPADLVAIAEQVHAQLVRPKYAVAHVVAALVANRIHGHSANRIYRDGGPHRDSGKKWIAVADSIEAERADATGESGELASVITLRKG